MDFKDLGRQVAKLAPLLGSALGPGGAAIGGIISSVFGGDPNDPQELSKLIAADPQAAVKLREIELNNKTALEKLTIEGRANELAADTQRIESVNATMRTEAVSGDKWQRRWRPFWGFTTAVAFFIQIIAMCAFIFVNPAAAPAVILAFAALDVFWAVPLAVLGVSAYQRGKEKRAALGENVQPLLSMFNKK